MTSKLLPKAASAVAILGVATGVAAQTTFNVSATVQNSLTVTNEADMNLGTLFATSAAASSYKYVTLSPGGTWGTISGHADRILLTLGGQQAARGSVAVGGTTPVKVTLPNGVFGASLATNGTGSSVELQGAQTTPGVVEVRVADPGVARFYLGDFRAGSVVSGTASSDCNTGNTCTITPSFAATSVSFGIGATLLTDLSGTRTSYEEVPYTGSFEVTASY